MASEYTIKKGDCLSRIARAHGISLSELRKANPHFWQNGRDPDLIYPGEKVIIPTKSTFSKSTNLKNGNTTCPKAHLTITVSDADTGMPIDGAEVVLTKGAVSSTNASGITKATDAQGLAEFSTIDPGTYGLETQAEGWCPDVAVKSVPAALSSTHEFRLRRARLYFTIYYPVADNAFKRAAETWEAEIRAGADFCAADKVIVLPAKTESTFKAAWASVASHAANYDLHHGALFTHASKDDNPAPDGLEFKPDATSDGTLTRTDIAALSVLPWGSGAQLTLMGCNTGLTDKRGWSPAGEFAKAQGVPTMGQTGYAYFSTSPSWYSEIDASSTNVYLWAFRRGRNTLLGSGERMSGRIYSS